MSKIEQLMSVQEVDKEIYIQAQRLAAIPSEIDELKTRVTTEKEVVKAAEGESQGFLLTQKEKEGQLATKEEQVSKLEGQLNDVKTNKEYTALQSEINNLKADNSVLEEEILKFLEEGQSHKTKIDEANAALQKAEAEFKEKEAVLLSEKQTCETEVAKCKTQKSELVKSVEPEILSMYERILEKRHGIALVPAVDGSCSACGMLLRAQTLDQLHMEDQTVVCEKCSRILYLQEV